MLKRDELSNPNSCLNRAREDEFVFVLLERDVAAAPAVRFWCSERVRLGKNSPDDPQIAEALAWCDRVDAARAGTSTVDCTKPPAGWRCTRGAGHPGPCAAVPVAPFDDSKPKTKSDVGVLR